jgi:hypothetical protein
LNKAIEQGKLSREKLIKLLEQCVNTRAVENGYADRYGLPFPRKDCEQKP